MYGELTIHRVAVCIGCLGLAALMPYGVLSAWLGVGLAVLPFAVLEVGAALVDHGNAKRHHRFRQAGFHVQAYGALLFLTPLLVFSVSAVSQRPPSWLSYLLVAAVGAPSCVLTIVAWIRVLFGRGAPSSDVIGVKGGARPGLLNRLSLVASEPFLFGGLALLVAAFAALGIVRGAVGNSGEMFLVLGLLCSAALLAVAASLDRWEERVPGTSLGPIQDALQTLAVMGICGSFFLGGLLWAGAPWVRWALLAFGTLSVVATIFSGVRRLVRRPVPYRLLAVSEGLLERSRQGALLYPWPCVLSCDLDEVGGERCVLLHIDDSDASNWEVASVRRGLERSRLIEVRQSAMESNRQWLGVDLFALEEHLDRSAKSFALKVKAVIDAIPGAKDDLRSIRENGAAPPSMDQPEA